MPLWHCPHCGTPQPESSRCWVCRRSTTSCATCRHFRRGVAGGLGLCGLDARRTALHGTEIRPCWAAPDAVAVPDAVAEPVAPVRAATVQRGAGAAVDARPDRTFVPIEDLERSHEPAQALVPGPGRTEVPQQGATPRPDDVADRWTLWGET